MHYPLMQWVLTRLDALRIIRSMNSFRDLINAIGPATIERVTGVGYNTIQGWRFRNSVPVVHWDGIIASAAEIGDSVTLDDLKRLAVMRRAPADASSPSEAA